jgi:thioredoxin reductase (NADPH)
MKKIVVYSTESCPYCIKAKALLASKGVDFEEIDIDRHPEETETMIERSGGRKTVPQIFIDDRHVGGCDDLHALDKEGKLDEWLQIDPNTPTTAHYRLIILGSGPSGYTAAIYAARANLSPLVICGPQKGGQLTTTTEVENFPGFPDGIDGNQLMAQMEKQALRFNAQVIYGEVTQIDLADRPFKLYLDQHQYTADALIIATGASARYLGLESEQRFRNKGVSACATCDGFFFRGQAVAVSGGGDTALEEANYLTNFCERVFVIHRRDEFRASKALQDRTFGNPKIEVVWNSVVDEVIGDDVKGMTDLSVRHVKSGEKRRLGVTGLFVAIGHQPNTKLFEGVLDMDEKKYLVPRPGSTRMNVEGVFACGDVIDSVYRQAITAAGTGCMAAIDAERWLAEQK